MKDLCTSIYMKVKEDKAKDFAWKYAEEMAKRHDCQVMEVRVFDFTEVLDDDFMFESEATHKACIRITDNEELLRWKVRK